MWCKALIIFAAATSAIIAANEKDDLKTKVHKKLDEYKGSYAEAANVSYTLIQMYLQKTNHSIAQLADGITDNNSYYSYVDAAKSVSGLEAKAKELGKNISACLISIYNLDVRQTQQINRTIKTINQAHTNFDNIIQGFRDDTLRSIELQQNQEASRFDAEIKKCSNLGNELSRRACLWEVLTEIEIGITQFESKASSLGSNLVLGLYEIQNKLDEIATNYLANWKEILKTVLANLSSCAKDVFGR